MLAHLISIIVPCYQQAEFLDECLQSVLDQTYPEWECLIIDDGSPDETEIIAKKWTHKDERFTYFKKENGGVASARNYGIAKAGGEWILPLDADDKIGKEYLKLAAKEFEQEYVVIYCKAKLFGEINKDWNLGIYSYYKLLHENHIFCTAFFKKESWNKAGGYDTQLIYGFEDWDFWLSILNENSRIKRIDYTGFFYRRKLDSRDVIVTNSKKKNSISKNYIFKKHLSKYLVFDTDPFTNHQLELKFYKDYKIIKSNIEKNLLTKILYKIIQKFN